MNRATVVLKPPLAAFGAGVLFAVGLALSRMTQPAKVQAFLDVAGAWDPSLAFVMAGAVGTTLFAYRLAMGRTRPLWAASFAQPRRLGIDGRLIGGAALFGVGWGLSGYCPGPALVSLVALRPGTLLFVAAMVLGMILVEAVQGGWFRVTERPRVPATEEG